MLTQYDELRLAKSKRARSEGDVMMSGQQLQGFRQSVLEGSGRTKGETHTLLVIAV